MFPIPLLHSTHHHHTITHKAGAVQIYQENKNALLKMKLALSEGKGTTRELSETHSTFSHSALRLAMLHPDRLGLTKLTSISNAMCRPQALCNMLMTEGIELERHQRRDALLRIHKKR